MGGLKRIATLAAAAFSVRAIVNFSKEAIELGSDLQEVQNVVDVTFGELSGVVNDFAESALESFGLSELAAKQYSSTIGAMLKSMGFVPDQAAEMSMALTGLAGDMASFYNLSGDDAFTKIRAGISGETEPLKQLGINLSVANLEQYALTQGIRKSYDAMTQQEQALLRYNYLLSVTADAQGDFARTSGSWANQTRILAERFNQIKATIGQGLINAFTPVIRVVNVLLAGLQRLASAFQQLTAILFGKAGGTQQHLADIADGYEAAAGGAGDLEEATKGAGKAAKKALAGFDEITKLGEKSSGGGDSGGAGAAGGGITIPAFSLNGEVQENISPQIQKIADKIRKIIEPLRNIDFAPLKESLNTLGENFRALGKTISDALEWVWNNILVPLATWTIEEAAPAAVDLLSVALDLLNEVLIALEPMATWMWDNFLLPIAQWTGGVIVDTLHLLTDALTGISKWISENQELVRSATAVFGLFMTLWKATDLILWIDAAGGIPGVIKLITDALLGNTIAKIANKAEDIALIALYTVDYIKAFAGLIAKLATSTATWIANTAAKAASTAATWAQIAATTAWNTICAVATTVTSALGAAIAFLTSPIGLVLVAIAALIAIVVLLVKNWDTVKAAATTAWEGIKSVWQNVSTWIQTNVLDPIANGFKGLVNGVIGFLNGMISGIVSGVNTAIRAVNKLSVTVPSWVPGIGGKSFGFNLKTLSAPQIPYLAQGAVIPPNAPFMAMLGDQRHGTNIEAPLSTIQEAVAQVMDDHISAMMSGFEALLAENQLLRATVESIEIGDDVLGKAANRYNARLATMRGDG